MTAIEITTLLTEADKAALWGWGDDIFRTKALALAWRPKEWHLIIRDTQSAISKVSVLRHRITVGNTPLEVGGIGGVVTVPRAQHRGLARELMMRAAHFMRDELALEFGFLFCLEFMLPFYRSLGWIELRDDVVIDQSDGRHLLPAALHAMHLDLTERRWIDGAVELGSAPW